MAINKGFYRRRRGIYEHAEACEINVIDLGVHDWLTGHARAVMNSDVFFPAGVWIGSAEKMFTETGSQKGTPARMIRNSLLKLERLGWLKKFRISGTSYAYVVNKMIVTNPVTGDFTVNATDTTDWHNPVYESTSPSGHQSVINRSPSGHHVVTPHKETKETGDTEIQTRPKTKRSDGMATPSASDRCLTGTAANGWYCQCPGRPHAKSAAPVTTPTPVPNISDIRDWQTDAFGIPAERLRNCLRYVLDYYADDYFKKDPPTLSSMESEKFVQLIHKRTPLDWTPPQPKPTRPKGNPDCRKCFGRGLVTVRDSNPDSLNLYSAPCECTHAKA